MTRDMRNESEFGLGPGLLDAEQRAARAIGGNAGLGAMYQPNAELMEIYATDPDRSDQDPATVEIPRVHRPGD